MYKIISLLFFIILFNFFRPNVLISRATEKVRLRLGILNKYCDKSEPLYV